MGKKILLIILLFLVPIPTMAQTNIELPIGTSVSNIINSSETHQYYTNTPIGLSGMAIISINASNPIELELRHNRPNTGMQSYFYGYNITTNAYIYNGGGFDFFVRTDFDNTNYTLGIRIETTFAEDEIQVNQIQNVVFGEGNRRIYTVNVTVPGYYRINAKGLRSGLSEILIYNTTSDYMALNNVGTGWQTRIINIDAGVYNISFSSIYQHVIGLRVLFTNDSDIGEPFNDSMENATHIIDDGYGYGHIGRSDDTDWYSISPIAEGLILVSIIGNEATELTMDVYLDGQFSEQIVVDKLGVISQGYEQIHLLVQGVPSEYDYVILVEYITPDRYESRSTLTDPFPITSTAASRFSLHNSDDVDYFKFDLTARSDVQLSINAPQGEDFDVVFDEELEVEDLQISDAGGEGSSHTILLKFTADAGTYHFHVSTTDDYVSTYNINLIVNVDPFATISTTADEEQSSDQFRINAPFLILVMAIPILSRTRGMKYKKMINQ